MRTVEKDRKTETHAHRYRLAAQRYRVEEQLHGESHGDTDDDLLSNEDHARQTQDAGRRVCRQHGTDDDGQCDSDQKSHRGRNERAADQRHHHHEGANSQEWPEVVAEPLDQLQ